MAQIVNGRHCKLGHKFSSKVTHDAGARNTIRLFSWQGENPIAENIVTLRNEYSA